MNRLALGLLAVCGALALAIAGLVAFDRLGAGTAAACTPGHFLVALWGDCGGPMIGAIALLTFLLFVLLSPAITILAIALVRWSRFLWGRATRGAWRRHARACDVSSR